MSTCDIENKMINTAICLFSGTNSDQSFCTLFSAEYSRICIEALPKKSHRIHIFCSGSLIFGPKNHLGDLKFPEIPSSTESQILSVSKALETLSKRPENHIGSRPVLEIGRLILVYNDSSFFSKNAHDTFSDLKALVNHCISNTNLRFYNLKIDIIVFNTFNAKEEIIADGDNSFSYMSSQKATKLGRKLAKMHLNLSKLCYKHFRVYFMNFFGKCKIEASACSYYAPTCILSPIKESFYCVLKDKDSPVYTELKSRIILFDKTLLLSYFDGKCSISQLSSDPIPDEILSRVSFSVDENQNRIIQQAPQLFQIKPASAIPKNDSAWKFVSSQQNTPIKFLTSFSRIVDQFTLLFSKDFMNIPLVQQTLFNFLDILSKQKISNEELTRAKHILFSLYSLIWKELGSIIPSSYTGTANESDLRKKIYLEIFFLLQLFSEVSSHHSILYNYWVQLIGNIQTM